MKQVTFVVEEAGCPSCAQRVRTALEPLAVVQEIEIDEEADAATVRAELAREMTESEVNGALAEASAGGGHSYRVRPTSWRLVS